MGHEVLFRSMFSDGVRLYSEFFKYTYCILRYIGLLKFNERLKKLKTFFIKRFEHASCTISGVSGFNPPETKKAPIIYVWSYYTIIIFSKKMFIIKERRNVPIKYPKYCDEYYVKNNYDFFRILFLIDKNSSPKIDLFLFACAFFHPKYFKIIFRFTHVLTSKSVKMG